MVSYIRWALAVERATKAAAQRPTPIATTRLIAWTSFRDFGSEALFGDFHLYMTLKMPKTGQLPPLKWAERAFKWVEMPPFSFHAPITNTIRAQGGLVKMHDYTP
jgi:hypothetical protein